MLHAKKRAEDISVEGRGVAVGGLLRHRAWLAFGAGDVDSRVQAPEGSIDQVAHIVLVAYVGTDEFGFRAKLANESLTCIVMATGDDDTVALLRKSKRRRSPDSS
jgi:hypothetical protein